MERTTLEIIAPSVEEALARGLEQLGVPKEMIDIEVLDEGTRGFLGLGSRQVRIRLSLKSADEKPASLASPQTDLAAAPAGDDSCWPMPNKSPVKCWDT